MLLIGKSLLGSLPSNSIIAHPTKAILRFDLGPLGAGTIDNAAGTVTDYHVPFCTNITDIAPTIEIAGKSIKPTSGESRDFTNPVTYTITTEDGSTKSYIVTVGSVQLSAIGKPDVVQPGGRMTYALTLTNQDTFLRNIPLQATLDSDTSFVMASDNGQAVGESSVLWKSLHIGARSSKTVKLTVVLPAKTKHKSSLKFTAQAVCLTTTVSTKVSP